ncbi:butyrate kinase [Zhaonella formicivorans]|uniref:butyrate kinase n=1 Tax=Zhaonella formicivorans TaxID=2528593 RepID=UPI0010E12140|nr:butyrate kinase [Zhaonella formicivorans]
MATINQLEQTNKYRILVINAGAASTKFAVFEDHEEVFTRKIEHSQSDLQSYIDINEQYCYRKNIILDTLQLAGIPMNAFDAIVARGGLLLPLEGGTYRINEKMAEHLKAGIQGQHASNLSGLIAYDLAKELKIPAFTVDPVSVDELEPVARISGLAELERKSLSHALNMKAVARKVAAEMGKNYNEVNFIVVHLGSGISVAPHQTGRMVDVNNPMSGGPFATDRCGGLPSAELAELCFSGKYTREQMLSKLYKEGGLYSYFGTKDVREVEKFAEQGNKKAELVLEAMAYQTAKEIGAMATVLQGKVDKIILTGGIAYSDFITSKIISRVNWIAPVVIKPGEEELCALAAGALRVLKGEERVKEYA